jgi:methionyl-tRNA formyltransferase
MRIVFMGTPEFAIPTLLEISRSDHLPVEVYTRAPAQRGRRGLELTKTPVHLAADSHGIPVFTPTSLRDAETQRQFENQVADLALVIAYGFLLPVPILEMPRFGCLNLHASLLPRWRGAAPTQRVIIAGDKKIGIDVMCMDAGIDTRPVAMRESTAISPDDTAGDLTARLASIAAQLAVRALRQ